jgi:PAS domain S-box-containing protein
VGQLLVGQLLVGQLLVGQLLVGQLLVGRCVVRRLAVISRKVHGARRAFPARTRLYVAGVGLIAATLASAVAASVPARHHVPVGYCVLFALMIALAERLQIRYLYSDHVEALTLVESVFAPLVFCASGRTVVLTVAGGILLGELSGRNGLLKATFNISQWVAAASAGSFALHLSGAGSSTDSGVVALVGAMLVVWIVNQLLITGVLCVTAGHPLGSRESSVAGLVVLGRLGSFVASTVLGLLMTAAYLWVPWVAPLASLPLAFLWSAGRAEAAVRADRRLLDALQRATHHLATSLEPTSALPPSLAQVRTGFEVREVQLVLVNERGFPTIYRSRDEDDGGSSMEVGPHGLAELLVDTLREPVRLGSEDDDISAALARLGHRRALAAPLCSGATTLGVLLLLDREGAEGFESGELSIAGALTREIVGFLERVDLVRAIDDERRKLTDIVENTGDGIVSLAVDGTILSWNAGMAGITGFTAEEMVGTRHFGLLRPRDSHGDDVNVGTWSSRPLDDSAADLQIVAADGSTVWLSCSYSRVAARDGAEESLIIVARNVTKARELEFLKDDFIAVVSHELRTPLVPIKGWAQTLLNRGERLTEDQRRTAVRSILTQAQRLEALVLNILESSRVEAGQAEALDSVDVAAVAIRVVEDVLAARPDRTIRVTPPTVPARVRGSMVWIDRAISNLVANAVKYSPDDEPVDVIVSVSDGSVSVSVTDRGPGISQEAQERIFERFERLEDSHKQTGTGLGLYITRRLARGMGGDVTVSSLAGAGSTFVLVLPVVNNESAPLPLPRSAPEVVSLG